MKEARQVRYDAIARRISVGVEQLFIVVLHLLRHRQHQLWRLLAVFGYGLAVVFLLDHMQHHVVVCRVAVVVVSEPL